MHLYDYILMGGKQMWRLNNILYASDFALLHLTVFFQCTPKNMVTDNAYSVFMWS